MTTINHHNHYITINRTMVDGWCLGCSSACEARDTGRHARQRVGGARGAGGAQRHARLVASVINEEKPTIDELIMGQIMTSYWYW